MFKQKSTFPSQHEQLDLSSIEDQQNENDKSNSDIDIRQMGLQQIDQEDFKNNVRELLLTDKYQNEQAKQQQENQKQHQVKKQQEDQNQFSGQPLKGSFLRDMEILCKTLSFQSTIYNIYQGCNEIEENLLSQLNSNKIKNKNIVQNKLHFKNIEKSSLGLQSKYIIDFTKVQRKSKKKKQSCKSKKNRPLSNQLTQGTNSMQSYSNFYNKRGKSLKQLSKKKRNQKSKASKQNCEQHKHSDYHHFIDSIKKGSITSSLRKVGFNSTSNEIVKGKKSEPSSLIEKQQRRKRIQKKFNLGMK